MAVLTISREFGSEGRTIAEWVAQTLGFHLVDKRTIDGVLSQYGFTDFRQEYDTAPGFWGRLDSRKTEMVRMLDRVIEAVAQRGDAVILGRGSFAVLGDFADVLNVRIQAPLSLRIKRVMERQQITEPDRAEVAVKESDKVRAAFIESFYDVRWNDATAFDMVIDTGKVSPELAVTELVEIVRALDGRKGADERTSSAIEVDPILVKAVAEELD
jgi:cytidylate kinase